MASSKKLKGFGINVELYHQDRKSIDIYIKTLIELRVEWVRLMFDFLDPVETEVYEYFINKCKKNKIKILGLLVNNIHGKVSNIFFPYLFHIPIYKQQKNFFRFVKDTVTRFKKKVSYWQILNEVNTIRFWTNDPSPSEYVSFLKKAHKTVKSIDNNARILFGSVVGNDNNVLLPLQSSHFFRNSMKIGAKDFFDVASFHPYFADCYFSFKDKKYYLEMIKKDINVILKVRDMHKKPVWITEFGISPRWIRLKPHEVASIYLFTYKLYRDKGIPFFLWQLTDTRKHVYLPGNPEKHFGLLGEDLHPKKVYNELIKLVNGR